MASRYWVGGTANWDATAGTKWATTSGGAGGAAVPTSADDVFFDASSGSTTATITVAANMRSINCTGYTGTLAVNGSLALNIGDSTAGAGNVALLFVNTMVWLPTGGNLLNFISTSTTVQTITTGGRAMTNMTFNGAGGSWQLADNYSNAAATLTLTQGTLDTNSKTISASAISTTNANTRTLTLGSSAITLSGGTAFTAATSTGLTVTANTATITMTGGTTTFNGGGMTYGTLIFNPVDSATVANFTAATLTFTGSATKTPSVTFTGSGPVFVTGTLTISGNSLTNRLFVGTNTTGITRTITAAAVSLSNVDFFDITGAGAASPFTGTSLGDAGGNSGITFTTPVTRYRVGAGGNWSDTSTWSASSGGATGLSVPLPQDTVFVDANASGTITNDLPRLAGSISFSGFAGTWAWGTQSATMYGSLILGSGMAATTSTATLTFAGRGSYGITSNGVALPGGSNGVVFAAVTGSYACQDDMIWFANGSLISGTLDSNGHNLRFNLFSSTGTLTRVLTITGTTLTTTRTSAGSIFSITGSGITVNASGSTIAITGVSANARTFDGNGLSYGTLNYTLTGSTGSLTVTGANTFQTINFSDSVSTRTLILPAATTTTVTNFNVNGTTSAVINLSSSTAGSTATLSVASGTTSVTNLVIQDITATGGATFKAINSQSVSNVSGWVFSVRRTTAGRRATVDFRAERLSLNFAGHARDASGNSYNGTVNGASLTTDRNGIANAAYTFNGTSNYIQVPYPVITSSVTAFTYSIWFKWTGGGGGSDGRRFLWETYDATSAASWILSCYILSGATPKMGVSLFTTTSSFAPSGSITVVANTWYQVVVVWDSSLASKNIRWYLNGVLDASAATTGTGIDILGVNIGTYRLHDNRWFEGIIDSARLWTRALTYPELQNLMAGSTRTVAGTRPPAGYLSLPGSNNNYLSTPSSTALQVTGDLDVRAYIAMDNYKPTGLSVIASKDDSVSNRSWQWNVQNGTGVMRMAWGSTGTSLTSIADSTVAIGATNGSSLWVRSTITVATGAVNFYTSPDGQTWTQLGTTVSTTAAAIAATSAKLAVGVRGDGASPLGGRIYKFQMYNSSGQLVASPDMTTGPSSGFSDKQGNVWTLTTAGGTPAKLVSRAS